MMKTEERQPLVVKHGDCTVTLYDADSLLDLPLVKLRKLWAIMFDAAWENETAISAIRSWLPEVAVEVKERLEVGRYYLGNARRVLDAVLGTVSIFGSAATKEQRDAVKFAKEVVQSAERRVKTDAATCERSQKLHTLFHEMAAKAGL